MPEIRILLVDDEPAIVTSLEELLRSMGYEIVGRAFSGEQALEMAKRCEPDLILMDIVMPGRLDGIEASEIIKAELDIPVIFLTAYADEKMVNRAKYAEPFGYIVKPFQGRELNAVIEVALYKKDMEKQRLRDSEEKYRAVIQQAVEAIYMVDPDTKRILEANPAFLNILGYTAGEISGLSVYDFSLEDRAETDAQMQHISTSEGITLGERLWRRKNGALIDVHVTASKIRRGGREIGFVVARDITKRKCLENELKKTAQDLKQTVAELRDANQKILDQQKSVIEEERLKILLQIAGATVHELNYPVTELSTNIELLKMKKDDPAESAQYLDRIEKAGDQISNIVKKIQTIRHNQTQDYISRTPMGLDHKLTILVVESIWDDFEKIRIALKDHPQINLCQSASMGKALEVLGDSRFDLIILDQLLPDGDDPLHFLEIMDEKGLEIPVVVITGQGDEIMASKAILGGAYDYLPKEKISQTALSRTINNALEKFRLKQEARETLAGMAAMAIRDELTGLYNLRFFKETLGHELARAKRYKTGLVVLMIDLDHFKIVNDTYGHAVGDYVLQDIARMLIEGMRQSDLVCRHGGEEFAVILPDTDVEEARVVSERFRESVSKHQFQYHALRFQLTLSIGIASFDGSGDQSPAQLVDNADQALYRAKREGRNRVIIAVN